MRYLTCFDQLTKRELEICGMITKGLYSGQIAKLLHLSEGTVKNYSTSIYEKTGVRNRAELAAKYTAEYAQVETDMGPPDVTGPSIQASAKLRLVGLPGLPDDIPLLFQGRPYVIGRFDASVGYKQCDFEFDKSTRAVSRRHASIERTAYGYAVVDLNSRAGTFINGNRITPGESCLILTGDRLSFGNAGADYVFEG